MSRSWHSSNRSRFSTGLTLVDTVSTPVPRTIPEMTRPPEITSIIAISSASRTGFSWMGRMLPSSRILAFCVVRASTAAVRLHEAFMHDGVLWCSLTMMPS